MAAAFRFSKERILSMWAHRGIKSYSIAYPKKRPPGDQRLSELIAAET